MNTKILLALLLSFLASTSLFAQFGIDKDRSNLGFTINHLLFSTAEGKFDSYTNEMNYDPKTNSLTVFKGEIDVNSINTNNKSRDEELRSVEIFNPVKFPKIKYEMTSIKNNKMIGNITIRGITKTIALNAKIGRVFKDKNQTRRIPIDLTGEINRKDFGIAWGALVESTASVGEVVSIHFKIEALDEE